ncbi:hypothetical protein A4R35_00200 [Thermogemmatispora tikiterensis]|uniref:Uncharacterized protein n=1 Tax=Thermogemmatispora tikiterensis TaxID=1825093 RepID=A0A328VB15_9CHLR|nr:hypothetical protein A4R35_00200 [Thermogemmatispora tikiterensis]
MPPRQRLGLIMRHTSWFLLSLGSRRVRQRLQRLLPGSRLLPEELEQVLILLQGLQRPTPLLEGVPGPGRQLAEELGRRVPQQQPVQAPVLHGADAFRLTPLARLLKPERCQPALQLSPARRVLLAPEEEEQVADGGDHGVAGTLGLPAERVGASTQALRQQEILEGVRLGQLWSELLK